MNRRRLLAAGFALALLSGCSGTGILNALASRDGYSVVPDQPYGDGPRRRLDLYIPEAAPRPGAARPTIVFFYGGNWETGSRADYRFVGEAFAARGYTTVIPDYRLYPEVRFPAFLEDAAAAVAWVHDRPGRAPGPIYLVGHSAGAYIVAMLALEQRWLALHGRTVCATVAAAVGLAGPYDFLPLESPTLKAIFGPRRTRPSTQPINRVTGAAPPMLLIAGGKDTTVRPGNSTRLAARIREMGGIAESRVYEGTGHVALVAALASPLRGLSPVLDDIDLFLRRYPHATCRTQNRNMERLSSH